MERDYWMGFDGNSIISASCPSGFCCQMDECDYIEDVDSLCALHRDPESFLCGKCEDGYSESMNSKNCTDCKYQIHWWYFSIPATLAFCVTMYLLYSNREEKMIVSQLNMLAKTQGKQGNVYRTSRDLDENMKDSQSFRVSVMATVKRVKKGTGKITLSSLAKIAIYYEQVSECFVPCLVK